MDLNKYKKTEQNILSALQSIRNGKQGLYDVVTWCVALFSESDSYAAAIGIKGDDVAAHIESRFLIDFNVELSELIVLLKVFPDREQWTRPLRTMIDEAHEQARATTSTNMQLSAARTTRRATLKELEQAETRAKSAEFQVARFNGEIDQLRAENSDLRRENLTLKGRIEELERLLSRRGETSFV
jgi:hypothetical protein